MMHIEIDSAVISPQVQEIFERVRSNADIMPAWQMEVGTVGIECMNKDPLPNIRIETF